MSGVPTAVVPYDVFQNVTDLTAYQLIANLPFVNVKDRGAKGDGQHSTTGSDDTAAITAAITAVQAAQVNIQTSDTPAAGAFMGTQPALYFPSGIYDISDEIALAINTLVIIADSNAIIRQNNAAKRIFVLTGAYDIYVKGLRTFGGTRHYDFRNNNVDSTRFIFDECDLEAATDWAFYTESTAASTYSTGTITVTAGSQAVVGSGTTFTSAMVGSFIRIFESGSVYELYLVAAFTDATHITLDRQYKLAGGAGKTYAIGDFHMSGKAEFLECKWMRNARMIHTVCDSTRVSGGWVHVDKGTGVEPWRLIADTSQIRAMGETMLLDGDAYLIPQAGTVGVDRVSAVRWVDLLRGSFYADHVRFGGEEWGMSVVWCYTPYRDASLGYTDRGATISIVNCEQVFAGPAAGTMADNGVIHLRSQLSMPVQIVFRDNRGPFEVPIVQNSGAVDVPTFMGLYTTPEKKFRFDIEGNATYGTETYIPDALKRFTRRCVGTTTLALGSQATNSSGTGTISVPGARANNGDTVAVDLGSAIGALSGVSWTFGITADDTVTYAWYVIAGPKTLNGTINVSVSKRYFATDV